MAGVLLLWDVDHTLIDNGGVSKVNYALAFELLTGRPAKTGGSYSAGARRVFLIFGGGLGQL